MSEEAARRAADAEQLQESEQRLQQTESLLNKYTRDYLSLKHSALQKERTDAERIEQLRCG